MVDDPMGVPFGSESDVRNVRSFRLVRALQSGAQITPLQYACSLTIPYYASYVSLNSDTLEGLRYLREPQKTTLHPC